MVVKETVEIVVVIVEEVTIATSNASIAMNLVIGLEIVQGHRIEENAIFAAVLATEPVIALMLVVGADHHLEEGEAVLHMDGGEAEAGAGVEAGAEAGADLLLDDAVELHHPAAEDVVVLVFLDLLHLSVPGIVLHREEGARLQLDQVKKEVGALQEAQVRLSAHVLDLLKLKIHHVLLRLQVHHTHLLSNEHEVTVF